LIAAEAGSSRRSWCSNYRKRTRETSSDNEVSRSRARAESKTEKTLE